MIGLRDRLAMAAMVEMLRAIYAGTCEGKRHEHVAEYCYKLADAMMKQREEKKP